ncbi:putative RNA-directed DNA polymerase from transposon BS [Stylophora pistillata]|uniref:Putative RNA-directed DNA polymerase from transposon BS n=1 Tax=Stylophora pistillata TaxID=50429 RepID=A0A2B4R706_STYPI|nr:putative RNA-directed DNA polymerase from transposon BS [Stylophora pistillata]
MTNEWKRAIKNKRKYAQTYARNRSPETWELKRKWRNIATRERRKAIKDYWAQKSSELKTRPRDLFQTFNPSLNSKNRDTTNISIRINDSIIRDQKKVVEIFGDYFSTMANEIGGKHVLQLGKEDFNTHLSVEAIRHSYHSLHFRFNKIDSRVVENELKKLNTPKATGKTHSCETNLIRVTEDWRIAMDDKECVAVLSTDMSNAFDSLHHALMTKKLEAYGFSDVSLELMHSHFTEQKNCVKINGVTSTWKEQLRGCPQGSLLRLLLWNIIPNDLPLSVQTSNLFMYADDHQVYQSGPSVTAIISELTNEAENVSRWYRENFFHANPKKYQVLVMTPRNVDKEAKDECILDIDNQKLKPTANLRVLGVNINDKLSFTGHIRDICKIKRAILCMNVTVDPDLVKVVQQDLNALKNDVDKLAFEKEEERKKLKTVLQDNVTTLEELAGRVSKIEEDQCSLTVAVKITQSQMGQLKSQQEDIKEDQSGSSELKPEDVFRFDVSEIASCGADITFFAERHHPDTRKWFLDDFHRWFENPGESRVYVLRGDAGVGKSVMADALAQKSIKAGNFGAAYSCRHNDGTRNNPRYLLRTIAFQLCKCNVQYNSVVEGEGGIRKFLGNSEMGIQELFTKLLQEPLAKCSAFFERKLIAIDALYA